MITKIIFSEKTITYTMDGNEVSFDFTKINSSDPDFKSPYIFLDALTSHLINHNNNNTWILTQKDPGGWTMSHFLLKYLKLISSNPANNEKFCSSVKVGTFLGLDVCEFELERPERSDYERLIEKYFNLLIEFSKQCPNEVIELLQQKINNESPLFSVLADPQTPQMPGHYFTLLSLLYKSNPAQVLILLRANDNQIWNLVKDYPSQQNLNSDFARLITKMHEQELNDPTDLAAWKNYCRTSRNETQNNNIQSVNTTKRPSN